MGLVLGVLSYRYKQSIFKRVTELHGFSNFIFRLLCKDKKSLSRFSHMNWICDYKEVPASPILRADTYFIEGSTYDIGGIHGSDIHQFSNTSFSSGYRVELAALANLVSLIYKPLILFPINERALTHSLTSLVLLLKERSRLMH